MHVGARVAFSACVIVFLAWPEFHLIFSERKCSWPAFLSAHVHESACRTLGCEKPFSASRIAICIEHATCMSEIIPGLAWPEFVLSFFFCKKYVPGLLFP